MLTLNMVCYSPKWSAIATLRGYPIVYEVPGTETSVISAVLIVVQAQAE